jgi:hypothetical protein
MNWFAKLPEAPKSTAGLEVEVLKTVPIAFMLGAVLIALPSVLARIFLHSEANGVSRLAALDSMALSALLIHCIALMTVVAGAIIVHNRKRPVSVADAYPTNDAKDLEPASSML